MSAAHASGEIQVDKVQVQGTRGGVEVVGLSEQEVRHAVTLLQAVQHRQLRARDALQARVNQTMLDANTPLVPAASQNQIQRSAALRDDLLVSHGYETYASLAESRGMRESSVRAWVARARERGELFTVKVGGQVVIPAVQLTADGLLDQQVVRLVKPLLVADLDPWSSWAWLCTPTGLLSGDVPSEAVRSNPLRALRAASRYADELARVRPDGA